MQMAMQFFKDMKIKIGIEVQGKITNLANFTDPLPYCGTSNPSLNPVPVSFPILVHLRNLRTPCPLPN